MSFIYEALSGYFEYKEQLQGVRQVQPYFGLIDDSQDRWTNFKAHIMKLNNTSPDNVSYRVIFLGRHGQGFHNVAETVYGTAAWDRYWSLLNGDGKIIWGPDPELTEVGIGQAKVVNQAWKDELQYGIPLPQTLYCSPLSRAIKTALITFDGTLLNAGDDRQTRRVIKEKLREMNGLHTCDKRNPRSTIEETYPQFKTEPGFTEEDTLWTADHRETEEELTDRLRKAMEEIFFDDMSTYISITAHGGAIRALLKVLNAPSFVLPTGGVTCVVVKVTKV